MPGAQVFQAGWLDWLGKLYPPLDKCLASALASAIAGSEGRWRDSVSEKACEPPSLEGVEVYLVEEGVGGVADKLAASGAEVYFSTSRELLGAVYRATVEFPGKLGGERLKRVVEEASEVFVEAVAPALRDLYPGSDVYGYLWVRVVRCPGGLEAPIIAEPVVWGERGLALSVTREGEARLVKARSSGGLEAGNVKGRVIRCPDGSSMSVDEARRRYKKILDSWERGSPGVHPLRLVAVRKRGSIEEPSERDVAAVSRAVEKLKEEWRYLAAEGLIPSDPLPLSQLRSYGVTVAYKAFTARQLLAHVEAAKAIWRARKHVEESYGPVEGEAAAHYLALSYLSALEYATAFTPWDSRKGVPNRLLAGAKGLGVPRLHGEAHMPALIGRVASMAVEAAARARGKGFQVAYPVVGVDGGVAAFALRPGYAASDIIHASWALRALKKGVAQSPPVEGSWRAALHVARARGAKKLVVAVEGDLRRLLGVVDTIMNGGWAPTRVGFLGDLEGLVLQAQPVEGSSCVEWPGLWAYLRREASLIAASLAPAGHSPIAAALSAMLEALGRFAVECWPIVAYSGKRLTLAYVLGRIAKPALVAALEGLAGLKGRLAGLDAATLLYAAVAIEGGVGKRAFEVLSDLLGVEPLLMLRCCLDERSGRVAARPLREVAPPSGSLLRELSQRLGASYEGPECRLLEPIAALLSKSPRPEAKLSLQPPCTPQGAIRNRG